MEVESLIRPWGHRALWANLIDAPRAIHHGHHRTRVLRDLQGDANRHLVTQTVDGRGSASVWVRIGSWECVADDKEFPRIVPLRVVPDSAGFRTLELRTIGRGRSRYRGARSSRT